MAGFKELKEEEISSKEPKHMAELKAVSGDDYRAQFLEGYLHCCLCGSELMFTHNTNFISLNVEEETFCANCHVRTKQESHCLH